VHLRLHQYRFESALKTWIAQVAYSIALRHLERKRIPLVDAAHSEEHDELLNEVSDDFDLEAASADEELAAALRRELEKLPAIQRTILMLYHFDELTIPEISEITGLAAGTIKSHLFRGRARLRDRMEALLGEIA
jgi:RNA polymerase sigma factor (sigma-70 family)